MHHRCLFLRLGTTRRGVTAIEYALIAALIAAVVVGSIGALGPAVAGVFPAISAAL